MAGVTATWVGSAIVRCRRRIVGAKQPAAPLVVGGRLVVVARRLLDYRSSGLGFRDGLVASIQDD